MVVLRTSGQSFRVADVKYLCALCGNVITVSVPCDFAVLSVTAAERRLNVRLQPWSNYGEPGLCLPCRLQAVDPEQQAQLRTEYEEWQQEGSREGIPSDLIIHPLFMAFNDQSKSWRGWRMRALTTRVVGLPEWLGGAQSLDALWGVMPSGAPLELLVYQTALWNESIPGAGLVFHSGPHRSPPELEIRNWRRVDRRSDLEKLMQGVMLYRQFRGERGRPRNTGRYESASEFARVLHPIITKLHREGTRPTLERVAEHLQCNPRTLQGWIGDYFSSHWIDVRNWPEGEWQRRMRS